uniref:Uncharacterized protein n=1 Tax=Octopus bimaculoides TaxID=37653 RepID=A0A0L8IBS8_OCTBM
MDDHRIPKQLFYGELAQGKRPRGRPKLRYKDTCKTSLTKCEVDVGTYEEKAEDKNMEDCESSHRNKQVEKRQRRKENNRNAERRATLLVCKYCDRSCVSIIGRISHERSCKKRSP